MMILMAASRSNSYAQLLTVLLIFVVVLGATALTTKWIAGYQKEMGRSGNIELLDAARLGNNKYIQIVRVGHTYLALAVCKDSVTVLCEISEDEMKAGDAAHSQKLSFQEILKRAKKASDIYPKQEEQNSIAEPEMNDSDSEKFSNRGEQSNS